MPRPLSFNPEEKLELAMHCFWQSGYAETSVSQLTDVMGINKFSMYKQFGDKETLYIKALEHYNQKIYSYLLKPLSETTGKESILNYLDAFNKYISGELGSHGCFLNNTLLSGPTLPDECRDLAITMASKLRHFLMDNFELAYNHNEITAKPMECVNFTTMTIQALLNTRRTLGPKAMSKNLLFFREMVESW